MSIVTRILGTLKGTDESKVQRFVERTVKHVKTQLAGINRAIEDLEDRIEDLKSERSDALVTVSADALNSVQATKDYIPQYLSRIADLDSAITSVEEDIEDLNDQKSKYESILSELEGGSSDD